MWPSCCSAVPAARRSPACRTSASSTAIPEGARLAMLQAEQAATSAADRATIATFVGDQLLADRDLAGAAAAYGRARAAQPGLATTELGRARLDAAQGRLDEAIATLATQVERSPAPAAAGLLGELQMAAGRDADATASLALAEAGTALLAGAGSDVDLESALLTADHGDPVEAVALAEQAYATRATVFTADALGWALHAQPGAPPRRCRSSRSRYSLGTRSPGLRAHAALAYAAAGQNDRAGAELTIAFESSAWLVPALRAEASALGDRLELAVPEDWRP